MNTPDAPDPRKVAEAALEAFVYVPLGLALEAKDLVPKLAQRGRNQVVLARLGARFAVQRAEAEAERLVKRMQDAAGRTTATPPAAAPANSPAPASSPTPEDASAHVDDAPLVAEPPVAPPAEPAGEGGAAPARPARRTTVRAGTAGSTRRTAGTSGSRSARAVSGADAAEEPAADAGPPALAIPGYDTLSASQVIPRLDALRPDELEAVRRHEADHRARRTILSRIAQLQG
jgi:hypothetical protein